MNPKAQRAAFVKEQQPMNRADILNRARIIVTQDREQTHGDAAKGFEALGTLWSVTAGVPLDAWQVALMLAQLKQSRIIHGDHTEADHWIDIAGYASLGFEVAQND